LKQTFLSNRLGALPRAPIQPGAPMPIFLLGNARSATSLLESMLAQVQGIDPADDRGPLPDLSRLLPKLVAGLGGPVGEFPDALIDTIAGEASGVPTSLILPYAPDWRGLHGRDDSLWYPSIKLYRQQRPYDWSGLVERLASQI
jgi:hypothetical protein